MLLSFNNVQENSQITETPLTTCRGRLRLHPEHKLCRREIQKNFTKNENNLDYF